jgi:Lar family restriction alleviation protein
MDKRTREAVERMMILPCPFCGAEVKPEPYGTYAKWRIHCFACGVHFDLANDLPASISKWNRRTDLSTGRIELFVASMVVAGGAVLGDPASWLSRYELAQIRRLPLGGTDARPEL